MNETNENFFKESDLVDSYTSQEALDDGFLVDITQINKEWNKGLFNYITIALMESGYINENEVEARFGA